MGEDTCSVLSSLRKRAMEMRNESKCLLCQIADLNKTLVEVDVQCDLLVNELIPISLLPNEILGEIFTAGSLSSVGNTFIICVCQVSPHFHRVALSTPDLWRTVNISLSNPSHKEMAAAYLLRSGTLPMDIRIHMTGTMCPNVLNFIDTIMRILKPQIERWCQLYVLCAWHFGLLELLDRLQRLKALLLQHVDIDANLPPPGMTDSICNIFTGGTPSLMYVRLWGIPLHCCLPNLATVTTLCIHSSWHHARSTYNDFYRMVNEFPALTHLVINTELAG
jgi:hypothetical protein